MKIRYGFVSNSSSSSFVISRAQIGDEKYNKFFAHVSDCYVIASNANYLVVENSNCDIEEMMSEIGLELNEDDYIDYDY